MQNKQKNLKIVVLYCLEEQNKRKTNKKPQNINLPSFGRGKNRQNTKI